MAPLRFSVPQDPKRFVVSSTDDKIIGRAVKKFHDKALGLLRQDWETGLLRLDRIMVSITAQTYFVCLGSSARDTRYATSR